MAKLSLKKIMHNAGRLLVRWAFSYMVSTLCGKILHYLRRTLKLIFPSSPAITFLEIYIKEIIRNIVKD